MEIMYLTETNIEQLTHFFSEISSDPHVIQFFHPHPLNSKQAREICVNRNTDVYFAALEGNIIAGYGMLRGWNEGYSIPTLGVCTRTEFRRKGMARALVEFAIRICRQKGSNKIMLKVYKDNVSAIELYKTQGFVFTGESEDGKQWIGYLNI